MLNKKEIEKEVVRRFLKNNKEQFDDEDLIEETENSIIDVKYKERKFQVVCGEPEMTKIRHTLPKNTIKLLSSRGPDTIFNNFLSMVESKNEKYDRSAKGVILLVYSSDLNYLENFWIKDEIEDRRSYSWNYNFHFDEIYLVCPNENIKFYP